MLYSDYSRFIIIWQLEKIKIALIVAIVLYKSVHMSMRLLYFILLT